jgi:hypothetical protein
MPPDMPLPHVVGKDLGLTCTGLATAGRVMRTAKIGMKGLTLLPLAGRVVEIVWLGHQIAEASLLTTEELHVTGALYRRPDLVMLEAPDVSRGYGGLVERIQLYHETLRRLIDIDVPFATVPSPVLKGYSTGNGGVDKKKRRVMAAVAELWPEYGKVNDDESDAIVLAAMGLDRLAGIRRVPDAQAEKWLNHGSIQWPASLLIPGGMG